MEGLLFGGAYVRRVICVSKSIGLAYSRKEICRFCFVSGNFQVQALPPGGGLYLEGRFNGGFLRYRFRGLIFGGAYFRNFTVCLYSY